MTVLSNVAWTKVGTDAPTQITLQNTGYNGSILIATKASLPGPNDLPNPPAGGAHVEALILRQHSDPIQLVGLNSPALNVYARLYGTPSTKHSLTVL